MGVAMWSYKIDGYELNDGSTFITEIPEVDDGPAIEPVTVDIPNDYPFLVRIQPSSKKYNVNIESLPCSWSTFQSRLATLRGLFSPGAHTLTVQTHGMTSPQSISVVPTSFAIGDPTARRVSIQVTSTDPVWA